MAFKPSRPMLLSYRSKNFILLFSASNKVSQIFIVKSSDKLLDLRVTNSKVYDFISDVKNDSRAGISYKGFQSKKNFVIFALY